MIISISLNHYFQHVSPYLELSFVDIYNKICEDNMFVELPIKCIRWMGWRSSMALGLCASKSLKISIHSINFSSVRIRGMMYRVIFRWITWLGFFLFLFIYSYVHTLLGPLLPPPSCPHPPNFQAKPVLPSSPILLTCRNKQ
jgi:hypothetical protein